MANRANWSYGIPLLMFGFFSEGLGAWLVTNHFVWPGTTIMIVSAVVTGSGLVFGDALRTIALKLGGKGGLDLRISSHAPRAARTEVKALPAPSTEDENDAG